MSFWRYISEQISDATGKPFQCQQQLAAGGGCINQAQTISDGRRQYFVKTNRRDLAFMFETEALALQEMAGTNTVRVPEAIGAGVYQEQSFLVLEQLDLSGHCNMAQLGRQLAAMHRISQPLFGWHHDNVIGSTEQPNQMMDNWIEFWRQNRLGFQLSLAKKNGYGGELQQLGERLLADFPALFESYHPQASMLHGDLWGGNGAGLADGTPVIFDPAFYYGDREADLAMTELFGGFSRDFYAAYNEAWPLDHGYSLRKTFYNIYHIINHLNLFGGGYHGQALHMMESLLSEI